MFAYFFGNPTTLANPLVPHINPALGGLYFIALIATFILVNGLIAA
jgi:hypothetical protein